MNVPVGLNRCGKSRVSILRYPLQQQFELPELDLKPLSLPCGVLRPFRDLNNLRLEPLDLFLGFAIFPEDVPIPRGFFDLFAGPVFGAGGKRPHLKVLFSGVSRLLWKF